MHIRLGIQDAYVCLQPEPDDRLSPLVFQGRPVDTDDFDRVREAFWPPPALWRIAHFGRLGIEFWKVTSRKLAAEEVTDDLGRLRGLDRLSSAAGLALVVPSVERVSDHHSR